jgi:hypothetical protein
MAPPPKKTPAVPGFDRIWHFRSPVRKTLRIRVIFLDNIPDALKASTQSIAGEMLAKASKLLDEHNLEIDHSADPTPFFSWQSRPIRASARDEIEDDMASIQTALLRLPQAGESANRLSIVFTTFSGSDNPNQGGNFRGWSYTQPSTRQNDRLEPMVFINVETVPSATDRVTVLHEILHCAGCTHVRAASLDEVAKGTPQDVMSVIGDPSGENTAADRTGMTMWQVQALAKFGGVPWTFDTSWRATERGWQ